MPNFWKFPGMQTLLGRNQTSAEPCNGSGLEKLFWKRSSSSAYHGHNILTKIQNFKKRSVMLRRHQAKTSLVARKIMVTITGPNKRHIVVFVWQMTIKRKRTIIQSAVKSKTGKRKPATRQWAALLHGKTAVKASITQVTTWTGTVISGTIPVL